jgi:hypothetical protein
MPKYRQLHLKLLDSVDFNEMPDDFTRLVWVLLPLIVDSEGRGKCISNWIRSKMFPLRDDITIQQLQSAIRWFVLQGLVVDYIGEDGEYYFYIRNFKKYQTGSEKEGRSYIPAPPITFQDMTVTTSELLRSNSEVNNINSGVTQSNSDPLVLYCIESELNCIDTTKKQFFTISDSEKALTKATNFFPLPQTYTPYLEKVLDLLQHNGWDDTVERLTRAKDNWVSQKRSINGANYKLTNPAWIDYAITGETVGVKVLTEQERIHQELAELAKKTEYQG